jgi:hypothetical protein
MKIYNINDLMAGLKKAPVVEVVQRVAHTGPERPGDEFNRLHTGQEVLDWLGFTPSHTDYQGEHWTRPGKSAREGSSATVYQDADGHHVTIWSDTCIQMWPALEVRRPYDPYGLYVATYFNGDHVAAAKKLSEEGYGEPTVVGPSLIDELEAYLLQNSPDASPSLATREPGLDEPTGWEPIDLVAAMRSGPPPPPDLFPRLDGVNILYRRRIHYFYGPPESLKSWAAQVAVAWTVLGGGKVIYLDFENEAFSFGERMTALSLDPTTVSRIVYLNPDKPFTERARNQLRSVLELGADMVVVDGVSNVMGLLGKSPLSHDDIVNFEMGFLRPLTVSGGAIVAIDHTAKGSDNGPPSLFGGQHKKAAVTGASFFFRLSQPFGRGMVGIAKMELDKDKPGYLRQHVINGAIAELRLYSKADGTVTADMSIPEVSPDFRPSDLMERISRYVERHPGVTVEEAKLNGAQSEKSEYVALAMHLLLAEGYAAKDLGSGLLRCVQAYRRADDFKDDRNKWDPMWQPKPSPSLPAPDDAHQRKTNRRMGLTGEEEPVEAAEPVAAPVAEPVAEVAEEPVRTDAFFQTGVQPSSDEWHELLDLGLE